jgi:hypothetical protein
LTLYKLTISQQSHFSPEDSMFIWNAGIYLQVHTALQPRIPTSTSAMPWELQISNRSNVLKVTELLVPLVLQFSGLRF